MNEIIQEKKVEVASAVDKMRKARLRWFIHVRGCANQEV